MTSIAYNSPDRLTAGAFRRIASTLLATDRSSIQFLLRVVLGAVMIPHGLQKTIGWFGGGGYSGTMSWLTGIGVPAFIAFLAIAAESAGAVALLTGAATRIAALGILTNMIVAAFMHRANGFLMNWSGQQAGEGFEYHILAGVIAVAIIIGGAGRWSVDRMIASRIH